MAVRSLCPVASSGAASMLRGGRVVGSLMEGWIRRTGHIERVKLNEQGEEIGREAILAELLRIEPVD